MIRSRRLAFSAFAALLVAPLAGSSVDAGDYIYGGVTRIADHCTRYGDGFIDVGNGVCGRTGSQINGGQINGGHVRVGGARNAAMGGWPGNGTSNAAMRSTGPSMVPGAEITQRLRVRGNLDSVSPFR